MENSEEKYIAAREKVQDIKNFYTHVMTFVIVNLVMMGINYYSNKLVYPWFLWATFGWGIGLGLNYLKTFDKNPFLTKNWEEKKIKEYMENDQKQHWE